MAGSSTSVTVKNEAAGSNTGNNNNTGSNTNTAALSADNSLKALTISPGTLSPAFKGSTTKYTATVDNSVTSIAVSATPVNEKATIESVTGNTNLAVGANVVQIVVKAENGTTATYKITVTRQAAGPPEVRRQLQAVKTETTEMLTARLQKILRKWTQRKLRCRRRML